MIKIEGNNVYLNNTNQQLIEDLGILFASIARVKGIETLDKYIKVARSSVDETYIDNIKQKFYKNFDKETADILCELLEGR